MITIKIYGGLGNQCFQAFLGYSLEANGNEVLYDTSNFDHDTTRRYCLADLGLNLPIGRADGKEIIEDSLRFKPEILDLKGDYVLNGYWQSSMYFERVRDRILSEVFNGMSKSGATRAFEDKILACNQDASFLHVRRSDNKLPDHKIKFGLPDEEDYYNRAVDYMTSVFLHVRRTDYANFNLRFRTAFLCVLR